MRCVVLIIFLTLLPISIGAQLNTAFKDSIEAITQRVYKHKNNGNYELALSEIEKGLQIANSINAYESIVDFYNLSARLNLKYNKPVNPEIYLHEAREVLSLYKYNKGKALTAILEGYLKAKSRQPNQAEAFVKEAFESADYKDKSLLNTLLYYQGLIYFELGQNGRAKSIFQKMIPPDHDYEQEYLSAATQLTLAKIYVNGNNLESAQILLDNIIRIAARHKFPEILLGTNLLRYEIANRSKDYHAALLYYRKADSIKQKYFNPDILRSQNEAAYTNEAKFLNNVIARMSQDEIEQQQKVNVSKLTSVLSSALLIIISLLTISLYRNNQIKFKTNDLLLKKNSELQLAKDKAEKAMRAKGQFLSTVSHELRTPLYAVTGLTHLLLEEDPKESQKEHLKSLKFSGEYLLDFINDILQINKIDANKLIAENIIFDLQKTLEDVVYSLKQTAKENRNTIILDIDKNTPKKLVGDPLKLSQILINLVGNALKFTENGKVIVHTKLLSATEDTYKIHFEVNDEGIGISEEMQKNIFESFSQGSIQINRKYGGTGLGLTIVKSLLSLFNSDIQVKSEIGMGSSFFFDLEFKAPDPAEIELEEAEEIEEAVLKDLYFLVVEDNKINQVITKKMLAKKGVNADVADNGYEAIELAKKNNYDLILMDIHMPGISGLKATEEIRTFNATIPIIALTALTLDESTDDFFSSGCNDIITKPFKPDLFYKIIGNALAKASSRV
ncbi:tetratricopeptide repeat-containing hybrid sensor histidine kinase/response regulator [Galbibacter mesophilus]|uniref:tetratricopeptide repeat-containing hybrid sensor histidine kinase/response regulator n=1 Tax=Galbibacter mesophilus TaxID=379069 RepID=UPI00191F1705|nr:response regulator [Galbibacter mesophilus]MCM5661586.1 response regulator [Galbibacter mesophilus]